MSDLDDFRSTILARQTEAEEAMAQGDPGPRMELWSRRDPVTLGPRSADRRSDVGRAGRLVIGGTHRPSPSRAARPSVASSR